MHTASREILHHVEEYVEHKTNIAEESIIKQKLRINNRKVKFSTAHNEIRWYPFASIINNVLWKFEMLFRTYCELKMSDEFWTARYFVNMTFR